MVADRAAEGRDAASDAHRAPALQDGQDRGGVGWGESGAWHLGTLTPEQR